MIYTWIRNGKPDVSMSLNGSLAGLVAVTAGCANVDVIRFFHHRCDRRCAGLRSSIFY